MKSFCCSLLCLLLLSFAKAQRVKIPIDTARWYQLNQTYGSLAKLFDGNKDSKAFTGWSKILYNYDAYYPLLNNESMTIDSVRFYDKEGVFTSAPLKLYAITSNWERKLIGTFTGPTYNTWVGPYPSRLTTYKLDTAVTDIRYLLLNINDNNFPGEIELYGTYTPPTASATLPREQRPLKNQFGINGFPWDLIDPNCAWCVQEQKLKAATSFRGFRFYLDWSKLEETEGRYTFSPMMGGGWGLDSVCQRLKENDIEVLATIQNIPRWMMLTYPDSLQAIDNNPVRYGKPYDDPASYIEQAKLGFQFAARYGRNKNIDSSMVSVYGVPQWTNQRVNQKKIGLGSIKYIECGNEQNKWWRGRKGYLSGREYAANISAFYDGHKGTLGPGVGVKNADSTMMVVITGLATINTDYVRGMIDWCKEFRGYKADGSVNLCFDVLNFHIYSNDANTSQTGSTRGVAPEKSNATQVTRDFMQLASTQLANMPIWITEQGYDENSGSPLRAIPIGSKTALQTQADWILRSGLMYAREGVERGFFYQAYDATPGSGWKFATMGLLNKTDYSRKPAADFLYQTNKLFGEFRYQETLNSDPFVDRYEYNGRSMYAMAVPDETGRTATYNLSLPGIDSATLYMPLIGSDSMSSQRLVVNNGQLQLTVTETPFFVVPDTASNRASLQTNRVIQYSIMNETAHEAKNDLAVFPNPTTGSIRVENKKGGQWQIILLDMQGHKAMEKKLSGVGTTLSLQRLPAGVYALFVANEKGENLLHQFVVKR